jgi:CubicO group peptidase (beta-lactamase class C family)
MTAAALAMLVDDGKVQWNDPVSRWLPELQFHDSYVTRELTVRDLRLDDTRLGDADLMTMPRMTTPAWLKRCLVSVPRILAVREFLLL